MALYHIAERRTLLIDRIRWGITLSIFSLIILTSTLSPLRHSIMPCVLLLGLTILYYPLISSALFYVLVHRKRAFKIFNFCQSVFNIALMTGFVHFTGGLESQYYFIYIFEIIIGGTILLPEYSFHVSTLAWLAYAVLLEAGNFLGIYPYVSVTQSNLFACILRSLFLAYIAMIVGNYIVKERRKQLEGLTTRLSQLNARLRQIATIDALTGIYNFRYFESRLEEEILRASRYKRETGLVLLDLDRFTACLAANGRQFGNKVLRQVADVMRENTRVVDTIARYDEDRFVLLLPETGHQEARIVAERICQHFREITFAARDGQKVSYTLSCGISTYPSSAEEVTLLLEQADRALAVAKQKGKDRIVLFSSDLLEQSPGKNL